MSQKVNKFSIVSIML